MKTKTFTVEASIKIDIPVECHSGMSITDFEDILKRKLESVLPPDATINDMDFVGVKTVETVDNSQCADSSKRQEV